MSTKKYHVNPKTGIVGECKAKVRCPFGENAPHFPTTEKAQEYADYRNEVLEKVRKLRNKDIQDKVMHTGYTYMVDLDLKGYSEKELNRFQAKTEMIISNDMRELLNKSKNFEYLNHSYSNNGVNVRLILKDETGLPQLNNNGNIETVDLKYELNDTVANSPINYLEENEDTFKNKNELAYYYSRYVKESSKSFDDSLYSARFVESKDVTIDDFYDVATKQKPLETIKEKEFDGFNDEMKKEMLKMENMFDGFMEKYMNNY